MILEQFTSFQQFLEPSKSSKCL